MLGRFFFGYILYVLAPLGKISISTGWDKEGHWVQFNQNWGLEDDNASVAYVPHPMLDATDHNHKALSAASQYGLQWWRVPKVSQSVRQQATKHNFLLGYEQGVLASHGHGRTNI